MLFYLLLSLLNLNISFKYKIIIFILPEKKNEKPKENKNLLSDLRSILIYNK